MQDQLGKVTALVRDFETAARENRSAVGALAQQRAGIAELAQTAQGLPRGTRQLQDPRSMGRAHGRRRVAPRRVRRRRTYRKQKSVETGSGIPDFTFLCPKTRFSIWT